MASGATAPPRRRPFLVFSQRPDRNTDGMMSDSLSLQGISGDDDVELVFDDVGAADAHPAPQPEPAPRRGRKTKAAREDAPADPVPVAEAVRPPADDIADMAAAEAPAGAAPEPVPPHATEPAGSATPKLLVAITLFALLTSLLSLGGLIAVGRTLASAEAERAHAVTERAALAAAPALLAKLVKAGDRLDAAAQRYAAAAPAGQPATIADVRHELDLLKIALAERQPEGLNALTSSTHSGLSEIATKIDLLQARLDQKPSH
jgi:hypothetical protein